MVSATPIPPIEPNTPPWFQRYAQQLQTFLGNPINRPLRLKAYATTELPAAAQWPGCLVFDSTTLEVKASDGSAWNAL